MVGMMGWSVPNQGWRKGPWTAEEDKLLTEYISLNGEGRWSSVSRNAGLQRSGKSCRLRWVNYLRPGLKKGQLTPQEESIIVELHALWGNKWSMIARYLPGRTDNEIKNYWRTHYKNKEKNPDQCQQKDATRSLNILQQQRKQQQQQQQKQMEEQKQQLQTQEKELDMQRIITQVVHGDGDDKVSQARGSEEMVLMYPTFEDQYIPVMYQDGAGSLAVLGDEGLWDGLWNLA